jgi:hypothetical protein
MNNKKPPLQVAPVNEGLSNPTAIILAHSPGSRNPYCVVYRAEIRWLAYMHETPLRRPPD